MSFLLKTFKSYSPFVWQKDFVNLTKRIEELEENLDSLEKIPAEVEIRCKVVDGNQFWILPSKAHENDEGWDIQTSKQVTVKAGDKFVKVPTNLNIYLREEDAKNYRIMLHPKSSFNKLGLVYSGGVIDQNFTGEIMIPLNNYTKEDVVIPQGFPIIQMLVYQKPIFETLEFVSTKRNTVRGDNGFGSTHEETRN